MPDLPVGEFLHYVGIDPGFTGAIGFMNASGTSVRVWDMPVASGEKDRQREIDLEQLLAIYTDLAALPSVVVGIEWPQTRPGEGAERSERFGRGKGILQAFAFVKFPQRYHLLAPNLWKGRLGVPGKSDPNANRVAAELFDFYYPEHSPLIRGPRGGIKDGRCDALLIAHFLRTRSLNGMQSIVDKFGKGSDEAMAFCLGAGGRRRKRGKK